MNKFSNGKNLPDYVFAEKFDSFMLFDFSSLIYEFDTLLIENLKMVVINYEKGIDFFIDSYLDNNNDGFLWNNHSLCEVKLNLQLPIESYWHKSDQLNEQEKNALEYYLWTDPYFYIYSSTQNWAIYCDRLAEICILGMKNDLIPYFDFLKESDELLRFSSVEDYFCKRDFIFKKEIIPWAIAEMKKNYPNIIS